MHYFPAFRAGEKAESIGEATIGVPGMGFISKIRMGQVKASPLRRPKQTDSRVKCHDRVRINGLDPSKTLDRGASILPLC